MPRSRHVRRACVLFLVFAVPVFAWQREEVSREFSRTLNVAAGQMLRVDHRLGHVRVRTHAGAALEVQATIRASAESQAAAARYADTVRIEITESPGAVALRTEYPEMGGMQRGNTSFSVDYVLTMPERMPLQLRSNFGNITITGVKAASSVVGGHGALSVTDAAGNWRIENSFGAIDVARVAGDVTITGSNASLSAIDIGGNAQLTNRFGLVRAQRIRGALIVANANGQVDVADVASASVTNAFGLVSIRSSGGNATVSNSNGNVTAQAIKGVADLRTTFGAIVARDVIGDARVENANGAITLADVRGAVRAKTTFGLLSVERIDGRLTAENANGGVNATTVRNAADVKTSFGPVVLRDIEGAVDVRNQNGAIDIALVGKAGACQDVLATTSFAPIQIQLPDGGYKVHAQTSFGRILSELPVTSTNATDGVLSGTIGNGACRLELTNANGDIRITSRPR